MAPRALIFDIEGTITSISFVKDTLFPYAVENVEKFLQSEWENAEVQAAVEGMREQAKQDISSKIEGAVPIPDKDSSKEDLIEAVSKSLKWLISIDNKNTHMKIISGLIWKQGYEDGKIKGHLYDDVEKAFKLWKDAGMKIYIYSSGSVTAQKLLVKFSVSGDLQPLIDDYFDTTIGQKRVASSYKNILEKISSSPEDTVFFTDIIEEADAANEAGINVFLLARDGNSPLSPEAKEKYTVLETFNGFEISVSNKRKSTDDETLPPTKIAKIADETAKDEPVVASPMEVDESEKNNEDKSIVVEKKIENDAVEENKDLDTKNEKESDDADKKGLNGDGIDKTDESSDSVPEKVETEAAERLETEEQKKTDIKENDGKTATDDNKETGDTTEKENESKSKESEIKMDVESDDKTEDSCQKKIDTDSKPEETPSPNVESAEGAVPIISNEDVDDEKLNALLNEEGVTLEKECEEILSKVEQVTNIDAIINKTNATANDKPEPESNGHSDLLTADNVLDEIIPDLPTEETPAAKAENPPSEDKSKIPEEVVKETNGKHEPSESLNGDAVVTESNGKIVDKEPEANGQDAEHNTNGTIEKSTESAENETSDNIKVKKVPTTTEESIAEKTEQLVDT